MFIKTSETSSLQYTIYYQRNSLQIMSSIYCCFYSYFIVARIILLNVFSALKLVSYINWVVALYIFIAWIINVTPPDPKMTLL